MVKFVSLAHLNPDQIGNILARATATTLLLKESGPSTDPKFAAGSGSGSLRASDDPYNANAACVAAGAEEQDEDRELKKSIWIPDDAACPKVWLAAAPGTNPPPLHLQQGPYHVSELLHLCEAGSIDQTWLLAPCASDDCDGESFASLVDTGRWQPLADYFQLRMQMLFPGKVVYAPAVVALKGLGILSRISSVHRTADCRGLPFYPVPASKRVMSEPEHLRVIAQLLLCNDIRVVDAAAELLCRLVETNSAANAKLYLTGAFYFACKYSGSNFLPLAHLFVRTHLSQSYHDGAASVARELHPGARSILANILPAALITVLVNYGAERFSSIFAGSVDTPEVIWNPELRAQLVEMIDQHIGNFAARLRQHTLSRYDYCPIPRVRFPALDREIYVHEFYIRNLCNEDKFGNWPISNPLALLRDTIERWRMEMAKGVVDTAVSSARLCLDLAERFDDLDLRRAYKRLARQYHPDRNPGGRDMFEKIQAAYELLSSLEFKNNVTNLDNVLLLVQTQNIIYRRYAADVRDQKYPVYRLLLGVFRVPTDDAAAALFPGTIEFDLPVAVVQLLHHTCSVSPLNAKELVKAGGIGPMYECISYALDHLPATVDMLACALKAFKSVSVTESGRQAILELCPAFAADMRALLLLDQTLPLVVEDCLEVISNCSVDAQLQCAFAHAGCVWMLLPLLLAYDATLQHEEYALSDAQRVVYNQGASNMHAILATKALSRLGGYMLGDLATPPNEAISSALGRLLTPPLARLLRNSLPWELLRTLNDNVETTTKIWNLRMRQELLELVDAVNAAQPPGAGSTENSLAPAAGFVFSALESEPCMGGVYVRVFIRSGGDCSEIESSSQFCCDLLETIASYLPHDSSSAPAAAEGAAAVAIDSSASAPALCPTSPRREYLAFALEALCILVDTHTQGDVSDDVAAHPHGPEIVFAVLEHTQSLRTPAEPETFCFAARVLSALAASRGFISAVLQRQQPGLAWKVLQFISTTDGPATPYVWAAAEHLVSHPDGIEALLAAGGIARILCCLLAVPGYANSYQIRLASVMLLSKFLMHPSRGADAAATLSRFLPEPMVMLMRGKTGAACLRLLDDVCETPELVWTSEMRLETRAALVALVSAASSFELVLIRPDFRVKFRILQAELSIGGVYIKLFLRQPTFRLSNPILLLEKVVERWESLFKSQVSPPPHQAGSPHRQLWCKQTARNRRGRHPDPANVDHLRSHTHRAVSD